MERRKNDSVCSLWHLHGKREAEATKNSMMEQLYEKNKDNTETYVEDIEDLEVDTIAIDANELVEIELGGYYE